SGTGRRLSGTPRDVISSGNFTHPLLASLLLLRDRMRNPPWWWHWEIELSPHVERRMVERDVTDVELRAMLERAVAITPSDVGGPYVVHTKHRRRACRIVLEPDDAAECVVVVTVYPKEEP